MGDTWWADLTGACPRLAALDRPGAAQTSSSVVKLVTVECLGQICEHPKKLPGSSPEALGRLERMCERLPAWMSGKMREEAWGYRFACPEVVAAWIDRPWTASNHLGFYKELRGCLEPLCMGDEVSHQEAPIYCELSAALAEGFRDGQAVPRLRERARLVRERDERELQGLSPAETEERAKAELEKGMKATLRRFDAACRMGMHQYCDAVTQYCLKEGFPPDVCPLDGGNLARQDAGAR